MTCDQLLLACDLDRTILPNGPAPLSDAALERFEGFIAEQNVALAYLSGRTFESAFQAIEEFKVPKPSIFVGNVGTSIYKKDIWGDYHADEAWEETFADDWKGTERERIAEELRRVPALDPQGPEHQGRFKQSYYAARDRVPEAVGAMRLILDALGISYAILVHEDEHIAYLDVIPSRATKEQALRYLQESLYVHKECVVYAGDAGNDLPALTSGYNAIVVKNAASDFKKEVMKEAKRRGTAAHIYMAKGNFRNMNGNYAAGILEGLHHFGHLD